MNIHLLLLLEKLKMILPLMYRGKFGAYFKMDLHLERMQNGLNTLRIPYEMRDLEPVYVELLKRNPEVKKGLLYIQISRGEAPCAHGLPKLKAPTIVAYVKWHAIIRQGGKTSMRKVPVEYNLEEHFFSHELKLLQFTYLDHLGLNLNSL